MINHIISECWKLAQEKYKTRHDWVGKRIPWELCKKLKFDHTNKWFTLNKESVLGKETHKLTVIPIVIGALGTVTKLLVRALEDLEITGRVETIQTTALLRSANVLRSVLETWCGLLSLKLLWKTISVNWWEKLSKEENNNKLNVEY